MGLSTANASEKINYLKPIATFTSHGTIQGKTLTLDQINVLASNQINLKLPNASCLYVANIGCKINESSNSLFKVGTVLKSYLLLKSNASFADLDKSDTAIKDGNLNGYTEGSSIEQASCLWCFVATSAILIVGVAMAAPYMAPIEILSVAYDSPITIVAMKKAFS
jgi:hypothetical protein